MGRTLATIALIGALGLGGCGSSPEIRRAEDLTGDGITDVLMYVDGLTNMGRGHYLFIGQEDGSFVRAYGSDRKEAEDFRTKDGRVFVYDGKKFIETAQISSTSD